MAILTAEMKEMVAAQQCFIATVGEDGLPNVAPKRSTRVLDDETLIFTEGTGGTTWKNIQAGAKVAVGVVNREVLDGYRFVGTPEIVTAGELFELAAEMSQKMGRPAPFAVVKIHIEEIYSLKPGPLAGKRIA